MGVYKVPQNVEAEDKILGPLTLKQFIYAMIGIAWIMLMYAIFGMINIILFLIAGAPGLLFLMVGLYQRQDQPFETYLVAIIGFFVKPRKRYWEKEPISEVFKVTPTPPKVEEERRDPRDVRGQLGKLTQVLDTRGWNSKQPELQDPDIVQVVDLGDRIGFDPNQPIAATVTSVEMADDIFSEQYNPTAAAVGELVENQAEDVREEARARMQAVQARPKTRAKTSTVKELTPNPDIIKLATEDGGDLTVAQLSAQAKRIGLLKEGEQVNLRSGTKAAIKAS